MLNVKPLSKAHDLSAIWFAVADHVIGTWLEDVTLIELIILKRLLCMQWYIYTYYCHPIWKHNLKTNVDCSLTCGPATGHPVMSCVLCLYLPILIINGQKIFMSGKGISNHSMSKRAWADWESPHTEIGSLESWSWSSLSWTYGEVE